MGHTGRRHDIAMKTLGRQVPLQGIAHLGGLVTDAAQTSRNMPGQLAQLAEQALQRGPALTINHFTGVLVEC